MGQFLGNDFVVKYELVCYDPFEAATNLGRVQAPKVKMTKLCVKKSNI